MDNNRVLIVENDEIFAEYLGGFLGGYDVTKARDVDAARKELKSAEFEIVFIDITIGDSDRPGSVVGSAVAELGMYSKDALIICMSGLEPRLPDSMCDAQAPKRKFRNHDSVMALIIEARKKRASSPPYMPAVRACMAAPSAIRTAKFCAA